jgi:hypothetical protein
MDVTHRSGRKNPDDLQGAGRCRRIILAHYNSRNEPADLFFCLKNKNCLNAALQREATSHENRDLQIWGWQCFATNYVSNRYELCIKSLRTMYQNATKYAGFRFKD